MKRLMFIAILMGLFSYSQAQPVELNSAINYLNDLRLEEAVESINRAANHERTKNDPATWFYKGRIYMAVYIVNSMHGSIQKGMTRSQVRQVLGEPARERRNRMMYDPEMTIYFDSDQRVESFNKPADGAYEDLVDEPLVKAYNAFQKTVEVDEDREFLNQVNQQLFQMSDLYYNEAVILFNKENFKGAVDYFERTYNLKSTFGQTDTGSLYNAAIAATNAQMPEKALKHYSTLINLNYNEELIYVATGELHMIQGDTAKAEEVLLLGRERHPHDYDILITLTNIYLLQGNIQESQELLSLALEQQPDNEQLYFNVGIVYEESASDTTLTEEQQEEFFNRAAESYKQAFELNEDYYDALYNLGALYFNKGVEYVTKANNLPIEAEKEYNEKIEIAGEYFEEALPMMEKAHEMRPAEISPLIALRELYTRTNQLEKLKEVEKIFEKIQQEPAQERQAEEIEKEEVR